MHISGFFGCAIGLLPNGLPVECGGCDRVPFVAVGGPPLTGRLPWIRATEPDGAVITHGSIWDSEVAGRSLLTFPLLPDYAVIPRALAPVEVSITPEHRVSLALAVSQEWAAELYVERNSIVGQWNGRPMIAATRLVVLQGSIPSSAKAMKPVAKVPA